MKIKKIIATDGVVEVVVFESKRGVTVKRGKNTFRLKKSKSVVTIFC